MFDHLVALSDGGPPQLELIQPGGGSNIWQEWLDDGRAGIHHAAVEVPSALAVVDEMERSGYPSVLSGRFGAAASSRTSTRSLRAASTSRHSRFR